MWGKKDENHLNHLRELRTDWLYPDSPPPTDESLDIVKRIIQGYGYPCTFFPAIDGGVQIEYRMPNWDVELTVPNNETPIVFFVIHRYKDIEDDVYAFINKEDIDQVHKDLDKFRESTE